MRRALVLLASVGGAVAQGQAVVSATVNIPPTQTGFDGCINFAEFWVWNQDGQLLIPGVAGATVSSTASGSGGATIAGGTDFALGAAVTGGYSSFATFGATSYHANPCSIAGEGVKICCR